MSVIGRPISVVLLAWFVSSVAAQEEFRFDVHDAGDRPVVLPPGLEDTPSKDREGLTKPEFAGPQDPSQPRSSSTGSLTGEIDVQPYWRDGSDAPLKRPDRDASAQHRDTKSHLPSGHRANVYDREHVAEATAQGVRVPPITDQDRIAASHDRPLFDTQSKEASLNSQVPSFQPNNSTGEPGRFASPSDVTGVDKVASAYPFAGAEAPAGATSPPIGNPGSQTSNSNGNDDAKASSSDKKLPLWPTMALFFSLAANLFFGWIAWDAHSRYQDLVEDLSESDARRNRQARRLRKNPATSSGSRDTPESKLLSTGMES